MRAHDNLWGLSWRVADIDATRARLLAAGVDVSEVRAGRKPGTRVHDRAQRHLRHPARCCWSGRREPDRPLDGEEACDRLTNRGHRYSEAHLRDTEAFAHEMQGIQLATAHLAKAKRVLKWQRDPEGMRLRILEAAKQEFAAHGLAGARVDRIAAKAGANKRMLYYHVGKKDDLYLAVLEGAYEKIRAEERGLDLEHLDPPEAIERLIDFTWNYFIRNPEFLALLNTENLAQGAASEAIDQGQIDAFAVRRDDPHRGEARRRERRLRRRRRSGATLHLDRGAVLLLSVEQRHARA